MSVILQIGNFGVAQGWGGTQYIAVTNSGSENVKDVFLKVLDTAVYDTLNVDTSTAWQNCLNAYPPSKIDTYETNIGGGLKYTIPAGTTRYLYFTIAVKVGAPIQVNNLVCYWQYITY